MWYKIAKYGYIDVQKELEEQLGYELPFKVDEYLKYIIIKASKFENEIYTIDFDKLDNFIKSSPFSHFVSKVSPLQGTVGDNNNGRKTRTVGKFNYSTRELWLIRSFPKYVLEDVVDTSIHEFAHAFDKGANKRPEPYKYSEDWIYELMPFFMKYKDNIIDENGKLKVSVDEMFNFFVEYEIEKFKRNFQMPSNITPAFMKLYKDAIQDETDMLMDIKSHAIKHLLFIIAKKLYENDVEQAIHTEYFNDPDEAPAQLNSLYRSSLPDRLLHFCKHQYLSWLKQTGKLAPLLEQYSIDPNMNDVEPLWDLLKEKVPNFIYENLKQSFIALIRNELFSNPNEQILGNSGIFYRSIRSKHVKRQATKILHDNFVEFQNLVNNL